MLRLLIFIMLTHLAFPSLAQEPPSAEKKAIQKTNLVLEEALAETVEATPKPSTKKIIEIEGEIPSPHPPLQSLIPPSIDCTKSTLAEKNSCAHCLLTFQEFLSGSSAQSPSLRWLELSRLMLRSCDSIPSTDPSQTLRKMQKLIENVGYCSNSNYPLRKNIKPAFTNTEFVKWLSENHSIKYSDSESIKKAFEEYFGLNYANAFFYFCKLQSLSPKKKISSLNKFGNTASKDFIACVTEAAQKHEAIQSQESHYCRLTRPFSDNVPKGAFLLHFDDKSLCGKNPLASVKPLAVECRGPRWGNYFSHGESTADRPEKNPKSIYRQTYPKK